MNEEKTIYINYLIDSWALDNLRWDFMNAEGRDVVLKIHSCGGSVFDGLAMSELINSYAGKTKTVGVGLIASMASVILMAANEVTMNRDSFLMIHSAIWGSEGNANEMRKDADLLDKVSGVIAKIYQRQAAKNGKEISDKDIKKMMDAETWLTAEEALELGLIDSIGDEAETATDMPTKASPTNSKEFKNLLSSFKNTPQAVLDKYAPKMDINQKKSFIQTFANFFGFKASIEVAEPEPVVEEKQDETMTIEEMKQKLAESGFEVVEAKKEAEPEVEPVAEPVAEPVSAEAKKLADLEAKMKQLETINNELLIKMAAQPAGTKNTDIPSKKEESIFGKEGDAFFDGLAARMQKHISK